MINYEENTNGYLDITFGPVWDYIPITRTFIDAFLLVHLVEKTDIAKVVTAASELLENAVKHANNDGIRIKITKIINSNCVELIVFNSTTKNDFLQLEKVIYEANNVDNTLEYYVNKIRKSCNRADGSAGLGIPRIRHESGIKLNISFFEGNDNGGIVEIRGVFNIVEEILN
ncbi:MAG: hypothetical protein A2015_14740 [Spirochaetes bacterium GWF1_31_7]|nr:MAG: hypothetical protein A2Y30_10425 [Spirochaetes bacterium GWE1_32_154]OHD47092.1 MAG: hypothetical protein A2Y29_02200 [Spirochaetes bacterium GWE2_31_10]OHD51735.1 MAG: hypothetical protein A2015_14740 [Spirochaetes bacterium GWF1_31_7]OHD76842.1 MAG: hypothetical protein A2355_05495 [Spirochaetes bacterium RIFOXYB1_FULL_32_8]HBD92674.1 hypothetical protein [Spirochaetia bacterium]